LVPSASPGAHLLAPRGDRRDTPRVLHAASAQRIALLLEDDLGGPTTAPAAAVARPPRGLPTHALLFRPAFFVILAATLHAVATTGFLAAPAFVPPTRFEARSEESAMRKTPKSFAVATAAALSIGALATAQDAVQWRVEDGGNGHWYRLATGTSSWAHGRAVALALGGDLSSIESADELAWIAQTMPCDSAYVGAQQLAGAATPNSEWFWLSGSAVKWPLTCDDNPCGANTPEEDQQQDHLHSYGCWSEFSDANIVPVNGCPVPLWISRSLVEWSSDCNSDGIVDFGQIRAGELDDANGNNIPDCCEEQSPCGCPADITGNGAVDGVDLAAVLGAWGGSAGGKSGADVNGDGSVDAADLAVVLGSWGPCP
jgi:hypothetical protein